MTYADAGEMLTKERNANCILRNRGLPPITDVTITYSNT